MSGEKSRPLSLRFNAEMTAKDTVDSSTEAVWDYLRQPGFSNNDRLDAARELGETAERFIELQTDPEGE
jgi:hypothetical protein